MCTWRKTEGVSQVFHRLLDGMAQRHLFFDMVQTLVR
jgi:hypothetical protein